MNFQTDVCIVGYGPAGAFLGYLLAKNGIKTTVIERTGEFNREFRGEHINSETEILLKEQHLFEKVEKLGILKMEKVEFFSGNQIVKAITPSIHEEHVGIHVPQIHLLNAIRCESEKFETFQLFINSTVTELIEDENGFYTGVIVKKGNEKFTINSSIIIGADGRFSTIRKLAKIPTQIRKHGYDVLWAIIPAPAGWEPTTRLLLVHGHQVALFTRTGGLIQIGWNIEEGSFSSLKQDSFEHFLEPFIKSNPELKKPILDHLHSWEDVVCLKVNSSSCETWVKNGLVIIGDAAHTMTPTGAIGINCAMKDAYVLAPIIAEVLYKKNVSLSGLRKFEMCRRAEIDKLQAWQIVEEQTFAESFK
jgi:2-polyprenyl-6-methoxyphenol hydroxylase-like FAD-dependent oxidoreductase